MRKVEYHEEALDDMQAIYGWIAKDSRPEKALAYVERLKKYCSGFDLASERGRLYDELRPDLRVVGFEKRVTIAFTVEEERGVILRIFYGGQDWKEQI